MDALLFSHDVPYAAAAMRAGFAGIIVDWEWHGKAQRQAGRDTEINRGTVDDLLEMRAAITGSLICRINNQPTRRCTEIRQALAAGADEVWLPMARHLDEVLECLRLLGSRARLGILVETVEALHLARELSTVPLSRVYIGLHDLHIDQGRRNMFEPLVDGSVERFREGFSGALGVAGITDPRRGTPIPQRLLLADMARLACTFGVARRSFRAHVPADAIGGALARMRAELAQLNQRAAPAISADHLQLRRLVDTLNDGARTRMDSEWGEEESACAF